MTAVTEVLLESPATATPRARVVGRLAVKLTVGLVLTLIFVVLMSQPAEAQEVGDPVSGDLQDPSLIDPLLSPLELGPATLRVEGPEAPTPPTPPDVAISIESENGAVSNTVLIILLLTVGAAAPSVLLLTTSFTRFVIVLGLTRNALGTQQTPPNQVLTGLALFLTMFVMAPVLSQINEEALQPLLAGEMGQGEAFEAGFAPLKEFMLAQTDPDDLNLLLDLRGDDASSADEIPPTVLVPAFVLSELKAAFVIGFMIFIPFLVIDLVVSSVLMSMGMVMLPPIFISLPLKLLLFVMVNGWGLIIGSVVESINGV